MKLKEKILCAAFGTSVISLLCAIAFTGRVSGAFIALAAVSVLVSIIVTKFES